MIYLQILLNNYCSGDLYWCGVRTSNPGVSRGTGVRFSLLSVFFMIN